MSEPLIARRCHTCGASIRDYAVFCPQCGKELKTTAELHERDPEDGKQSTTVDTAPLDDPPIKKEQLMETGGSAGSPDKSKVEGSKAAELSAPVLSPDKPAAPEKETAAQAGKAKVTPGAHVFADARGKMQRATGLARNVGGDVVQRGHKLREMSSVVLDEASYDPSLRFVLVAAALFLLFLVMVLLNRFIV